jgi:AcrR family transcriptional regulator
MIETKEKILNAAEKLFADQGVAGTSLRQIVGEAGVNLAAVHYHFGSKDEMLDALVKRKAGPVNDRRLALLDTYVADARGGAVPVEKTLWAFLSPMADVAGKNPQFVRVMGRIVAEGLLEKIIEKNFHEVLVRFTAALRRAVPELPEDEFRGRIHFMIGVIAHTMHASGGQGFEAHLEWMIQFLAGGLCAPAAEEKGQPV